MERLTNNTPSQDMASYNNFKSNYSGYSMNGTNYTFDYPAWNPVKNPFEDLHIKAIFITMYSIVFGFCFFGKFVL